VLVLLEGDPAWVDRQAQTLEAARGAPAAALDGSEVVQMIQRVTDRIEGAPGARTETPKRRTARRARRE